MQQDRGVAFGRVAVLLADDALELAEAHAILVGHVGTGVQRVALLERVPEPLVAHDHRVDDAELVERVVVLAQDADLRRTVDRSTLRRLFAGQQLHERRLAGAVGSGETVAPARGKAAWSRLRRGLSSRTAWTHR